MIIDNNEENIQKLIASDMMEDNSKAYGKYILSNQFPSHIDGLKKVKRRLIWALRNEKKKFSGIDLVGKTTKFHPYGDGSIYDSAVKMSQAFNDPFVLLDLKGDSGTYSGDEAAHVRYVEFELSEFTKDVFLKSIDLATLSFERTEDLLGFEPTYLIPKIPTALLFHNDTIGFGFKSLTLSFDIKIVGKMVISYINFIKKYNSELSVKWDYSQFLNKLIPIFPIQNVIRNPKQIINEYKNNNFKPTIIVDGLIKILNQNTIMIYTIPFKNPIVNLKKSLIKLIRNKTSELAKQITSIDYAADNNIEAKILIKFKRNCNIFKIIDNIKYTLKFTVNITPFTNYVYENEMVTKTPIDIIKDWYKERYLSILSRKKQQQKSLISRKIQLKALLIVSKNTDEIITIIRNDSHDVALPKLMKKFKLSFYQSTYILNSKLSIIAKASEEEIQNEYDNILIEIDKHLKSFNLIPDEIINDINFLVKKYKTPAHCSYIPKYIGYIEINNKGVYNFESLSEAKRIVTIFNNEKCVIKYYPKNIISITGFKAKQKIIYNPEIILPHTLWIDKLLINIDSHNTKTIILNNGYQFYINGCYYEKDKDQIFYTEKNNFKGINSVGKIIDVSLLEIPIRSNINNQGNKTNNIYYFDIDKHKDGLVLIYHSSKIKNKILMKKITNKTNKVIVYVGGKTTILGIFDIHSKDIFLNDYNGKTLIIKDFDSYFKKKDFVQVKITKFI